MKAWGVNHSFAKTYSFYIFLYKSVHLKKCVYKNQFILYVVFMNCSRDGVGNCA